MKAVRNLLEELQRYSIELRVVRRMLGESKVCLIAVRSLLEKCEVFD